ncbi:serine/threonine-protein kinase [Mycobacterium bourgelatii]|uniref:non-specific serine/threonine protein kinase n=1 Tax=Mycobacterium bourgelatii TaxID=1273442 RepID=A0A7I9YRR2_MYCBU|nr:serine/threonine-protein kinase [Mycobacterium bourgelatii]MCV6974182.1 serine/threonine protein kinase [Mycobacterium bourgelatii]GFG91361.1 hypothetical protein MBOU_34030 [Mycobacterium bourgelatii]
MASRVGGSFGKYQIRRLLGSGGMGEVYEAYDTDKGRTVALKLLADRYAQDQQFRTRFLRESRAAAILQEPHVIPIHDWGEIDGILYIDMRLVRGQTLHDILAAGPLEPERAIDIIRQVAAALDAAHAQGLIHRDVKPQNIIVTADDFAYLVDFGIAEAKGDTHLTQAGQTVGSWAYMAPERFRDEATTPAVDIYGLACVLFEALTGSLPFPSDRLELVIGAHMSAAPPRPSALIGYLPRALDDVIACGMAKHPEDRYTTAGGLARAAKRALAGPTGYPSGPISAPRPTMPPPSYPPYHVAPVPPTVPPRVPQADDGRPGTALLATVIGLAAALVIAIVVVVVVLVGNNDSRPPSPTVAYTTPQYTTYPTAGTTTTRSSYASTPTTTASQDPEQQLRQLASGDRAFVASQLADRWVPQLSSKRPGVVDNGVVWDNQMALDEFLAFKQRYGAKLLWSGDWSTFSAPNFWVTVVPITYRDPAGALAWCRSQGYDRDHCIAKIISTTHPVDGSTAYNN